MTETVRAVMLQSPMIIAFITEGAVIRGILGHLGEPTSPPCLIQARGPPLWEMQDSGSDAIDA
ncbi:hypothetical protein [Denitromonas halophila]|uniref:Uncharacterized protein n=1 Tax=Denitromonas halophila TaxID=1629404 RepID=A0A557QWI7_9RHOO|nr:hypothetical protein [Denitromonas halophila]TVO57268.1 hypothetical protein FHP91_10265 [Denitromonas halophila]